jgi:Tubulin binding cofactor C
MMDSSLSMHTDDDDDDDDRKMHYRDRENVDNNSGSDNDQDHQQDHHMMMMDDGMTLTAKPHAFAGAVLSPKHARDLTPSLCLAIASALSDQSSSSSVSGASPLSQRQQMILYRPAPAAVVPYTLWITEAWRVLGWAEPSAALFWEMATMYHTLYLASREFAAHYHDHHGHAYGPLHRASLHGGGGGVGSSSNNDEPLNNIPPILSCGSASSVGSGTTAHTPVNNTNSASAFDKKKMSTTASAKELPVWLVGTFLLLHCEEFAYQRNLSGQDERRFFDNSGGGGSAMSSSSSLSLASTTHTTTALAASSNPGGDYSSLLKHSSLSPRTRLHATGAYWNTHAGEHGNYSHCTAYLLRHLRKFLLLTAVPHNQDAVNACMHLAALPSPSHYHHSASGSSMMLGGSGRSSHHHHHGRLHRSSSPATAAHLRYSTDDLRRQHEEEHGQVGLNVQLTVEDLERLNLMLQPPQGGGIDDAPLRVGEFLWSTIYMTSVDHRPPMATILLADVEREVRRQLELDLLMAGFDKDEKDDGPGTGAAVSSPSTTRKAAPKQAPDEQDMAVVAMSKLSISDKQSADDGSIEHGSAASERAKQPNNQYLKELSYTHLRGTTILLKPNPIDVISSGASDGGGTASGGGGCGGNNNNANNLICSLTSSPQRLHDLAISECSDAHFYLLQPFEHATIAACTGCTIVVGAVAGLLHVVDCERTVITAAARRILVSNSSDVTLNIFSPSPPLLVGDNRTCQFAPYNSYYDGFREDLLATGLAAAVVSESNQSPYHAGGGAGSGSIKNAPGEATTAAAGQPQQQGEKAATTTASLMADASWPPLQCASNKWKQPVEMAKLEMPEVHNAAVVATATSGAPGSPTANTTSSAAADDKAPPGTDSAIHGPVIVPASEFHVLFIPLESDAARQRRLDAAAADDGSAQVSPAAATTDNNNNNSEAPPPPLSPNNGMESQYCRLLAEVLHLSPFRLPAEYERRVLVKCERMKNIQQAVQKHLTLEQQGQFEEELNRGFRDWLVTSGNLRQVLDLVHLERRGQVG